jgi:hypothetical protein
MQIALPLAQLAATGWLPLAVGDTRVYLAVNETYTAEVMNMTRIGAEYPPGHLHCSRAGPFPIAI